MPRDILLLRYRCCTFLGTRVEALTRKWLPRARKTTADLVAATEQATTQRTRAAQRLPSILGGGTRVHNRLTKSLAEMVDYSESVGNLDCFVDDLQMTNTNQSDGCTRKAILAGQNGSSITDDRNEDDIIDKVETVLPLHHLLPDNDIIRTLLIESTKR